ncbi:hypothetical protein SAMN05421594_0602 [Chryseobacterium oleae]|uniref:Uncharacterized protein n=1 Tax=Chryseobacterium oleae TaxID=491207 RepID=A0A1I4VT47_CHROL|nr:hypothetical protein SAMN05421594_0602 [Chryseobacterium oleae]
MYKKILAFFTKKRIKYSIGAGFSPLKLAQE